MRTSKVFGVKNLMHLIYGLVILLPMFAILGRVIYTQANPNAKDSYYGETINETIIYNASSLKTNVKYTTLYPSGIDINLTNSSFVYLDSITFLNANNNTSFNTLKSHENEYWRFRYITNASNINIEFQRRSGDTNVSDYYGVVINHNTSPSYYSIEFEYYVSENVSTGLSNILPFTTYSTYNKYSYIDNAFEYSLSEFVKDNNLGNVDLFEWFTNMFLNQSNPKNQLYLNFVNWYLNYTLLVSSGYLLFLVLIWFINYVRKIMDKSMYQDYGGF